MTGADGNPEFDRKGIADIFADFYEALYKRRDSEHNTTTTNNALPSAADIANSASGKSSRLSSTLRRSGIPLEGGPMPHTKIRRTTTTEPPQLTPPQLTQTSHATPPQHTTNQPAQPQAEDRANAKAGPPRGQPLLQSDPQLLAESMNNTQAMPITMPIPPSEPPPENGSNLLQQLSRRTTTTQHSYTALLTTQSNYNPTQRPHRRLRALSSAPAK